MQLADAANCLEALGHETRLEIVRLLIRAGEPGVSVGTLQDRLGIPASTLSHHLSRLVHTELASQERQSRTLLCRINFCTMRELMHFMLHDCCAGLAEP